MAIKPAGAALGYSADRCNRLSLDLFEVMFKSKFMKIALDMHISTGVATAAVALGHVPPSTYNDLIFTARFEFYKL